ncbi:MAG: lycopene cyclase domain-containing protein [Ignavibacteria bacterium]|nr:lycopene cyclase domain-containing protein [Ignavibacteria bacterium]
MKTYFILLLSSFLIPFLFSFERQIFFIKNLKFVFKSVFVVAIPYLIWDEIFTSNKIWGFSSEHIVGFKILNLPIEEILFFVVVPYVIIFVYEVINFYLKDKVINLQKKIFLFASILNFVLAMILIDKTYTATQLIVTSLFFFFAYFFGCKTLERKNFWVLIFISFVPFFIVNYFLTSLPVVWYNENKITGLRIITIPIEDFLYHFTMTSFYILSYNYFKLKK